MQLEGRSECEYVQVYEEYKGAMGINDGDLIALRVAELVLVSCHAESGGMATADVLQTVRRVHAERHAECKLVVGIDGNTYYDSVADGKKKYSVKALSELLSALGLSSCPDIGGDDETVIRHTTNHPRTYLQPQLNKAVQRKDVGGEGHYSFRAPKDFIVFDPEAFGVVEGAECIDNTGRGQYDGDVEHVMPSEHFPSDHAILSTQLVMKCT